ncbi:BrxA family protein [Thiolapillus sp.]|uniref:BrxA family protein n=1 Tax=Thiolapillus sp. TaxID=2017437 RepID=UPI003AF4383B
MTYHNEISADDFDVFFNAKMEIYPELEKITDSTRKKQRQVLFRIMREAQIIDSNDTIIPASLTARFRELLCSHQPQALVHFPLVEGCQ